MDHQLKVGATLQSSGALAIRLDERIRPISGLAAFADLPDVCLLHSAAPDHPLGRYSFLAADPVVRVSAPAGAWPAVANQIRGTIRRPELAFPALPPLQGGWLGWLSYELGTAFNRTDRHEVEPLPVPDIALGLYDWVIAWDHHRAEAWLVSAGVDQRGNRAPSRARERARMVIDRWNAARPDALSGADHLAAPTSLTSDFSSGSYQQAVATAIDHVLAGDIFQVNLSQRFSGSFTGNPLVLFSEVCRRTPAPMAAFIKRAGVTVVSASPERFLRFDARSRQVETRPIKGTRPRHADPARDAALAEELGASEKDRAENVMIVDLMRNDLARACLPGSVDVAALHVLESHPTVHHLVSTITGVLRPEHDALDLVATTFPGGSITGAPKLRAMSIIRALEPISRGVYSGAIGWIGLDGGMDTSIAIRTMTITDEIVSFHAGGGITAQSNPGDEHREALDKARALLDAAGAR